MALIRYVAGLRGCFRIHERRNAAGETGLFVRIQLHGSCSNDKVFLYYFKFQIEQEHSLFSFMKSFISSIRMGRVRYLLSTYEESVR